MYKTLIVVVYLYDWVLFFNSFTFFPFYKGVMGRIPGQSDSRIDSRAKLITLYQLGWNQRQIAFEVGLSVSYYSIQNTFGSCILRQNRLFMFLAIEIFYPNCP